MSCEFCLLYHVCIFCIGDSSMKMSPSTRIIQLMSKMSLKERRELLKMLIELFSKAVR